MDRGTGAIIGATMEELKQYEKENNACINNLYPKIEKLDGNIIYTDTDSLKVIEQETAQRIYDTFLKESYK